jgi:hypothetical protein
MFLLLSSDQACALAQVVLHRKAQLRGADVYLHVEWADFLLLPIFLLLASEQACAWAQEYNLGPCA